MTQFQAEYFDGISARSNSVNVQLNATMLVIEESGGQLQQFALADVIIQPKLGKARRIIDLPDGGRLEADNLGGFEALQQDKASLFWRVLHYLENHLAWVGLALLLSVAAGWAIIKYGIPAIAQQVAEATPPAMESKLGQQVLAAMDHQYGYFKPSRLAPVRIGEIKRAINNMCAKQSVPCPRYTVEFRDGAVIGANALALPGGFIVVTDQLIKLAHDDNEVVAVIAHEMGHVHSRHAFRQTLQGALSGLVIVALTGDLDSLASGLPALLLQMDYSRNMESEADRYALHAMQQACIQPQAFADILQRLSSQSPAQAIPEIISSHPDTLARIQPFLKGLPDCPH